MIRDISMRTTVTSRHFKAHRSLTSYAEDSIRTLTKYYDGIIKTEVILSFEKARNSTKTAEMNMHVYNAVLTGRYSSGDFFESIDGAVEKLRRQLTKYKEKKRRRDRSNLRRVREKI